MAKSVQSSETSDQPDWDGGPIFHIARPGELAEAQQSGVLVHLSLGSEGFIHCSFASQILRTVAKHFDEPKGLLLLEVDCARLEPVVVVEDSYGSGMAFPHIYGPLDLQAVVTVHELQVDPRGLPRLPQSLKHL